MKVECSICHVEGILEQKGNSQRVLHYRGISNGKRMYEKHAIKMGVMGVNGNKPMRINARDLSSFSRFEWTGGDLNPRPPECKSGVHTN